MQPGGHGIKREVSRNPQQSPSADDDEHADDQTDGRIEPDPACPQDNCASNHLAERYDGVRRHMHKCALDVQIVLAARHKQEWSNAINDDADCRHDHYNETTRRFWINQAADAFRRNAAGDDQQHNGVGKRGKDRSAA